MSVSPPDGLLQRIELPAIGTTLVNRYVLEQRLAMGGSAAVFRARDTVLEQVVALKIIHSESVDTSSPSGRILSDLRHEAIASMQLSHPNIIRIYNYEKSDRWGFLVMEFLVGEDLRSYRGHFPRKCLTPDEAMRIGERALRGLSHAHGLGIVHHDIKPANVLITPSGEVKLCDFGLSALAALASRGELNESVVAGTPQYISPEAINRLPVDGRSDLYSLAATLYDLVVGVPPFGRDPLTAYRGHLYQAPPNNPQLPSALGAILFKALAKKPEERFESAEAMRTELLAIMSVAKSKPGPVPTKTEAPTSTEPQVSSRSGEEGQDEWIELEEEMVVDRDASTPRPLSPMAASPPLPDEPMTKPPPLKSNPISKGQVNPSMKSLEQLVSQESWLQAAARADGNGNVQELVGKADGESVSAAVAMCFQPLEKAAELLGFGSVTSFCLGSKKSVIYVRREGSGFTVGIGQAASNPEVSMKKFTKALAEK